MKFETKQDQIKYNAKDVVNSVSWLDHTNIFESLIFKSKDELLKSLFGGASSAQDKARCKGKNCTAIKGVGHSEECKKEYDQACGES